MTRLERIAWHEQIADTVFQLVRTLEIIAQEHLNMADNLADDVGQPATPINDERQIVLVH